MTVLETDETPDSARRYYVGALGAEGWSIEGDMAQDGLVMVRAVKDDRSLTVAIMEEGGVTKVTLMSGDE